MSVSTDSERGFFDLFRVAAPICAVVALLGILRPEWLSAGAQAVTKTSFRALD